MKLLLDLSHDYLKCGANEVNSKLETQNISASESLEMGKGDKLLLCSTAIGKKEGEKLLRFSYF